MHTRFVALSLALASTVALVGCTAPATEPTPDPAASSAAEPAPSLTPNPPEPTAVLWVRATATAPNGAVLDLEGMLHHPVSFEYPGSQTLNQMLIDDCGATLTNAIIYDQAWSFSRMNVTAIPPAESTTWPEDARVGFLPSGDTLWVSGRGMLQSDASTGDLACVQDKFLVGAGRGALVGGLPGDTVSLDEFGNAWATHSWGFVAGVGVTLSDCSFELTELGRQSGGGVNWVERTDASTCVIGPPTESSVF